ncbi:MAG TPA: hypothetical protein VIL90_11945 [Puia sp.]|jgi:hypothetical protein
MDIKYFFTATVSLILSYAAAQNNDNLSSDSSTGKTSWYGFDRYDFVMDSTDFTIRPFHSDQEEKTGISKQLPGKFRCLIVVPKKIAPGKPWSWRGCYWDHEPQTEVDLLHRGFHIAYIMSDPGKSWDAWYEFLTKEYGFSGKPAFIGMSKGGVNEYSWATMNPDKVSCIYADNPALYPESMERIGMLAHNDVPLLHVCGSFDFLLENHTLVLENLYHQMGGRISVMIKEGTAHHPHSLRNPSIIADWIEQNSVNIKNSALNLKGMVFDKSYYYSFSDSYNYLSEENTYAICRGPFFTPCYERYDQQTDSRWGITGLTIIVPVKPASAKLWVFRADRIGREPSAFDLALLKRGFYIVAAPVTSQAGPLQKEWDSVYNLLVANGFSKKVVLEGDGSGAGEAYAWAVLHSDLISSIFSMNPVLRSLQTKLSMSDNLGLLAHSGISLINVCGGSDPWLKQNTLAVKKRYKELGGKMKVILHQDQGHFVFAPGDPEQVADFIQQNINR